MSTPPTADDAQCELDRIHVKLQEFSEVGLDDDLLSDWIDAEVKELPRFVRANHVKVVLTAIKGWKEKSLVSETKAADLQRMVFNARPREPPKPSTLIVSKNKPPLLPREGGRLQCLGSAAADLGVAHLRAVSALIPLSPCQRGCACVRSRAHVAATVAQLTHTRRGE